MQDAYPKRATNPGETDHLIRFVGGSAAVTKVYGPGVTVAYTNTGIVTFTWAENPGTFLGANATFQATTPGDVAGHTAVFGAFNTTAFTLVVRIYNASDALHDLAALEWLACRVTFARNSALL